MTLEPNNGNAAALDMKEDEPLRPPMQMYHGKIEHSRYTDIVVLENYEDGYIHKFGFVNTSTQPQKFIILLRKGSTDLWALKMVIDDDEDEVLNAQTIEAVGELKSVLQSQGKGAAQKKVESLRNLRRLLSKSGIPPIEAVIKASTVKGGGKAIFHLDHQTNRWGKETGIYIFSFNARVLQACLRQHDA
ncbi:hypothetical protein GIB67_026973 [Kingdonia uniflora]|uniref:Uncharacterized protein n=1 Tax=Kingdonia uniflora TaxID=39325 RepID=A0A7J7P274_9MAGN|nr:hypothetical protein GIB67_026973 [Kingdonia uniflora]